MIGSTLRIQIDIQAGDTPVEKLKSIFSQFESKIESSLFRRFRTGKILGRLPDGKARSAIVVGDNPNVQLEYVAEGEDFIISSGAELTQLFIISAGTSKTPAVIVLQF